MVGGPLAVWTNCGVTGYTILTRNDLSNFTLTAEGNLKTVLLEFVSDWNTSFYMYNAFMPSQRKEISNQSYS